MLDSVKALRDALKGEFEERNVAGESEQRVGASARDRGRSGGQRHRMEGAIVGRARVVSVAGRWQSLREGKANQRHNSLDIMLGVA